MSVKAISSSEVAPTTYIIGNYMFTRNKNDNYDGVLNTKRIMLAARTITGTQESDMIIYYKNAAGRWIDGLSGKSITVPSEFNIEVTDLNGTPTIPTYSDSTVEYASSSVGGSTYVIGSYVFTRTTNDNYDGVLNTRRIMLASKTLTGTQESDMIIYYKTATGRWIDGLSGANVTVPNNFMVSEIDLQPAVPKEKPTMELSVSEGTTYAKSKTATVTISDEYGLVANGITIKYAWGTSSQSCSSMTSSITITPVEGSKTATGEIIVSGETGAGYLYVCNGNAIVSQSGESLAPNNLVKTNMYLDNEGPVCTWGNWSMSIVKPNEKTIISLSCTDRNSGIGVEGLAENAFALSNSNLSITNITSTAISYGRKYTVTVTAGETLGETNISLLASKVYDNVGNYADVVTSNNIIVATAPSMEVTVPEGTTYAKSKTATVTLSDSQGLAAGTYTIKYAWGTTSQSCSSMTSSITITPTAGSKTATGEITISGETGKGYIYICNEEAITNIVGATMSAKTSKSAAMYLDNAAPECTWGSWSREVIQPNETASITLSCADKNSGIGIETLTASAFALSNSNVSITSVTSAAISFGRRYIVKVTAGETLGENNISLLASKIYDNLGNYAGTVSSSNIMVATAPTMEVTVPEGTTYAMSKTAIVTISDSQGLTADDIIIKYAWGTSSQSCSSMTSSITITPTAGSKTATGEITISGETGNGKIYICNANDIINNIGLTLASGTLKDANMYLDNNVYTLTFNPNGGIVEPTSIEVNVLSNLEELPVPIRDGYNFVGWYKNQACTDGNEFDLTQIRANMTIYAKWEDARTKFLSGREFNEKLKKLSGQSDANYETINTTIKKFKKAGSLAITLTDENIVSSSDSKGLIYAWYDNGTIYYYSESTIYMNENSTYMFDEMRELYDLEISNINTSSVTNMSFMFNNTGYNADTFELDISNWNTSNVTDMGFMFNGAGYNADTFELDLSNFDVSNVTTMYCMLYKAGYKATTWSIGDISGWDVSKVTQTHMLLADTGHNATVWNVGDLSNWNVSSVIDMAWMFYGAGYSATTWSIGDLSEWDVSNVVYINGMFNSAGYSSSTWDIGDISGWNVSNVTQMNGMFSYAAYNADTFELDLSSWDTSKVTNMSYMFHYAGYNATTWSIGDTFNVYATNIEKFMSFVRRANLTINIYSDVTDYSEAFEHTAILSGARVTVNYSSVTSKINNIINTASNGQNGNPTSNVHKGVQLD